MKTICNLNISFIIWSGRRGKTKEKDGPLEIEKSKASLLYDKEGRTYVDCISGVSHGKITLPVYHLSYHYLHLAMLNMNLNLMCIFISIFSWALSPQDCQCVSKTIRFHGNRTHLNYSSAHLGWRPHKDWDGKRTPFKATNAVQFWF